MKRLIISFLFLAYSQNCFSQNTSAVGGSYPIKLLQSPSNYNAVSPVVITLTKPFTNGSFVVAACLGDSGGGGSVSAPTDQGSDVFVHVPGALGTDASHTTDIFYCPKSNGGSTSVTVAMSAGAIGCQIFEVIGMSGYSVVLDTANSKSSGTSSTSASSNPPISTNFSGEFGVSSLATGGAGISVPQPWTMGDTPNKNGIAYYGASTNTVSTQPLTNHTLTYTQTAGTYCLSLAFFIARRNVAIGGY